MGTLRMRSAWSGGILGLLVAACGSDGGSSGDQDSAPVIKSFSVSETEVLAGRSVRLAWEVEGAASIRIESAVPGADRTLVLDDAPAMGSHDLASVTESQTFHLIARAEGGAEATKAVSLRVIQSRARIVRFEASAPQVAVGGSVTLSWEVEEAESIRVLSRRDGQEDVVLQPMAAAMGELVAGPLSETTTFVLEARDASDALATQTLQVEVPTISEDDELRIVSFEATPNPAVVGGASSLSWTVHNADSVRLVLDGDELFSRDGAGIGEVTAGRYAVVTTAPSHTVMLVATQGSKEVEASIEITAETAPYIQSLLVQPTVFTEASVDVVLSWSAVGALTLYANDIVVSGAPAMGDPNAPQQFTVNITETTEFRLVAEGAGFSVERRATAQFGLREAEPNDGIDTASNGRSGAIGAIDGVDDRDYYAVELLSTGWITVETTGPFGGCPVDTRIELRDDQDALLFETSDGGLPTEDGGECAAVLIPDVPAGLYFVVVAGEAGATGDYAIQIRTGAAACGNGIPEATTEEFCDDGNLESGDGCSSQCTLEFAGRQDAGTPADQVWDGQVNVDGFVLYEVELTEPGYVLADLGIPALGACDGLGADAVVLVLDSDFAQITGDGISDEGECASIGADAYRVELPAGLYYVALFTESGAPIPNYELKLGVLAVACGNGIVDGEGETCDDGNQVDGDFCSASCQFEPLGPIDGSGQVRVPLATVDDTIRLVEVNVPENGMSMRTTVAAPDGSCPFSTFMGLVIQADEGGYFLIGDVQGECAGFTPEEDVFATDLAAGQYFIALQNISELPGAELVLNVTLEAPSCGNGIVETFAAEICDDANLENDDGCSSACQPERATPIGNGQIITSSLNSGGNTPGEQLWFEIEVEGDTAKKFGAALGQPELGLCLGPDIRMQLFEAEPPAGETTLKEVSIGFGLFELCPEIPIQDLAPGTYWLAIDTAEPSDQVPQFQFDVTLVDPGCGNGLLERDLNETCDDGNLLSGDRCSSACEAEVSFEVEPNNAPEEALIMSEAGLGVGTATVTVGAAIDPAEDVDFFLVTIPEGGAALNVRTYFDVLDMGACNGDTVVRVLDAELNEVAFQDDADGSLCSHLRGRADQDGDEVPDAVLPAGQYYVTVSAYSASALYPLYFVDMSLEAIQ